MTPEQQAEMRDSQAQLADLDRKLAEMPEDQRQMVMRQMGPQLEAVRKMSSGEGFQMESVVHQIVVNPDATALNALLNQSTSVAGQHLIPAGAAGAGAEHHLARLAPGARILAVGHRHSRHAPLLCAPVAPGRAASSLTESDCIQVGPRRVGPGCATPRRE